jgi:hypothetical protein
VSDRRVHAAYPGMEIVRYDRAGKWYLEPTDPSLKRQAVSIDDAVRSALWGLDHDGLIFFGKPGGAAFDAKVRP